MCFRSVHPWIQLKCAGAVPAAALELTLDAEAPAALDPLSDQVMGERCLPAFTAEIPR